MWEIQVQGDYGPRSRAPDPEGTPLEVARQFLQYDFEYGRYATWPDSTPVVLSRSELKKHGRGKRVVRTEVQRFTLGELRPATKP
jgi:hypothetical protein